MKVLVTGGTGVIGAATVNELLKRGHAVRLLTRGADEDSAQWSGPVEAFPGDTGDAASVRGAADGCTGVIHITGVREESEPDSTFERINIQGTRNIVAESARAGVRRLVFVSSLGAQRGESDYSRSKLAGEDVVRNFAGEWTIVRVGTVMGPGDETVSVLLRTIRTLPAVPIVDGDQLFQPVWHEDVGWALAECVDRDDVARTLLRIAGPDRVTVREVVDLFGGVTGRRPLRLRLPAFIAKIGRALASVVRVETPAAAVPMLVEGDYLRDDETNDLTGRLGRHPEPTRDRLIELADSLPEQTPDDGVGKLKRRRFRIDIHGATMSAADLMLRFCDRFADIVPIDAAAEPATRGELRNGATLTLQLPARGHVQVRVEEISERTITLATLEGHPLAGVVRFQFVQQERDVIRFTIDVIERAASRVDQISMALGGNAAQGRTWTRTAENVAAEAGGVAPEGVVEESWSLDDDSAAPIEEWVRGLVRRHHRATGNRA